MLSRKNLNLRHAKRLGTRLPERTLPNPDQSSTPEIIRHAVNIVGRATAFCGPICVGIIAAVTPSRAGRGSDIVQPKPIRSPEEERIAQGEHDWYKAQCEDKKISTGNKCLDLLSEANRAWACSNSMLQWDERWQPGRYDLDIAIQERKYHRLMKAYKE